MPKPEVAARDDSSGHRARVRERLFKGGKDALHDHELIEYLLTLSIKRIDTKPLARELLDEFGGIGGLLTADAETIIKATNLSEVTVATIKIVQAAALRLLQSEVMNAPVLASWQALLDYLRADMAHKLTERVRWAYALCFSRWPTPEELAATQAFFNRFPAQWDAGHEQGSGVKDAAAIQAAYTSFCRALFGCAEFRQLN